MRRYFKAAALLLAAALLIAVVFLAVGYDHECPGDGCGVCAVLTACRTVLCGVFLCAAVLPVRFTHRSASGPRFARRNSVFSRFLLTNQKVLLLD